MFVELQHFLLLDKTAMIFIRIINGWRPPRPLLFGVYICFCLLEATGNSSPYPDIRWKFNYKMTRYMVLGRLLIRWFPLFLKFLLCIECLLLITRLLFCSYHPLHSQPRLGTCFFSGIWGTVSLMNSTTCSICLIVLDLMKMRKT